MTDNNYEQLKNELSMAIINGESDVVENLTHQAIRSGMDPLDLINKIIVPTLTRVGQDFQDFKIFLPELMAAGQAAEKASTLIQSVIDQTGQSISSLGTIIIGAVENDIHDIGKNIVGTLLKAHGFRVIDLGRNVSPSTFLESAVKEKVDIVAMSSLMTTTRPATRSTIRIFEEVGQRKNYKIIVGGGSVTRDWAEEISADGYSPDAAGAVELCKALISSDER